MRIIGGDWRGRKLPVLDKPGLRPTGDRIRETLFNWLMADIRGSRCLDLFAGSGALGLEALSRGAAEVDFVELDTPACSQLRDNLALVKASNGSVHNANALAWIDTQKTPFDIVFIDPPFAEDFWHTALQKLLDTQLLTSDSLIYVEQPKAFNFHHKDLHAIKDKTAGQVRYGLYQIAVNNLDNPETAG